MAFVRIEHPDIDGTAHVSERALPHYEALGWQQVTEELPARPQRNDRTAAWRRYAVARGLPADQATAMSRDGDDGLIAYIDRLDATDDTQES